MVNENGHGNALTQRDLKLIERVIQKSGDDIAVSIARSFERMQERIDAAESRLYRRIADFEDKFDSRAEHSSDV